MPKPRKITLLPERRPVCSHPNFGESYELPVKKSLTAPAAERAFRSPIPAIVRGFGEVVVATVEVEVVAVEVEIFGGVFEG